MLLAPIVATSIAVVPMVERCRSALTQHVFVPGNDVSIALLRSELSDAGAEPVVLSCGSEIACAQPLWLDGLSSPHDAMDADAADVMPTVGCPPDAERQLAFSYVISPVREAVPRLPPVVIPEPCALPSNVLDMATARMIYAALTDGTVNPRAREWRMPLVRMLVDGTPGTDFDCVYRLLLHGFGGNDERTKIRALTKWAEANLPPREAADVCRAETRYWLNLGDAVMTVDAAGRMERARPDYAVRARRLSALAYAMSGELENAKAEIARSRAECSPMGAERHELLYLEAWIALQEGDVELARRNLAVIVAENPRGATARKARQILESISMEAHE